MDGDYDEHSVSVKIALYSHDLDSVLLMKYSRGIYGLPGGHLDANEMPDEALVRELMEELSVQLTSFEKASFFMRSGRGSSVILGYTGIATEAFVMDPTHPEKEVGVWATRQELESLEPISDEYKEFIFGHWPASR